MNEAIGALIFIVCVIASLFIVYHAGIDAGKRIKVCEPGYPTTTEQDHKVICRFENDKVEIRKY